LPSPYGDAPDVTTLGFWKSGEALKLLGGEIALSCPVRLLHGLEDADVPWQVSRRLMEALRSEDVRMTLVKGGDHRLSRDGDVALLIDTVETLLP
jgi:pimeloyl-ACP methyl ester carboxylesterase